MSEKIVTRILTAVCVMFFAATACAADKAVDKFVDEIIAGAKTNSARAAKLLEAAKVLGDQPKICVVILEKVVEFGTKAPVTLSGVKVAGDALDMLDEKLPDKRDQWASRRIDVCRAKYRCARSRSDKIQAGEEFTDALMAVAETCETSGDWAGAISNYREAGPVAVYTRSGAAEEIRRKLKTATQRATIAKKTAKYAAELTKDPSKSSTRDMLVKLMVMEMDDPAGAVKYLSQDADEMWRTCLTLAAKEINSLSDNACLQLGQWYYKELSKKASPTGKIVVLQRARGYYKRFTKLHRKVDVQSIRAKADLAAVEKELAKFVILPKTLILNLGKGGTMRLARIPAGKFIMGSPKTEKFRAPVESPQHEVTLARSFYMGVCEVTQTQWFAVMGSVPWRGHKSARSGANHAASCINWNDASKFCRTLSKKIGKKVTLPSEAQWEYACRAGTKTAYSFGNSASKLGYYAWYNKNAYEKGQSYAHPVGQKKPNAFGLYDMHGNVWEWCQDQWRPTYRDAPNDGSARKFEGSVDRVLRGGSWSEPAQFSRSASRITFPASAENTARWLFGLRVVVEPDSDEN